MICFLRSGSDYLEDSVKYSSIADAVEAYRHEATSLARFEQVHEATIHIAKTFDEVVEYPDMVLTLTPRGAVKIERT